MKYNFAQALDFVEMSEFDDMFKNIKDYRTLQNNVDEFKERLKKQRKILAKKYHPDINPYGSKDLKEINAILDALETIKIRQQPRIIVRAYSPDQFYRYTNFTDTAATGAYY
jgi:archaellum component FlaC